ncbi:MAG: hypothetical protein J6J66_07525 [Clostridia bacterium]|nr:hypothetical protein [Clostridia bacterium]
MENAVTDGGKVCGLSGGKLQERFPQLFHIKVLSFFQKNLYGTRENGSFHNFHSPYYNNSYL